MQFAYRAVAAATIADRGSALAQTDRDNSDSLRRLMRRQLTFVE
jgi:hypothetical protein